MAVSRVVGMSAFQVASRRIALIAASAVFFATVQAQAQQAQTAPEGRVIVTGEGDVAVAEVYTHASGLRLGQVKWIMEDTGLALPVPMRAQAGSASMAAPVPIATGEDMLRVKITVGFEIAP